MKRALCLVCCLALLLGVLPSRARANSVSDVMRVVNCSEWVSLREYPDTNAKRVAKVYLGELVNQCAWYNEQFVWVNYQGKTGYILLKYLQTTTLSNYDEIMYNQMVVNCEEWVSLREYADAKSKRLAKVPVGAILMACVKVGEDFVRCEYKKQTGYISTSYLKKANYNVSKQDSSVVSKAEKAGYKAYRYPMTVVNTQDWVSLREKASASSSRLAKVPLGATVSQCIQVSGSFVYCQYRGVWGYIKLEYLQNNDPQARPAVTAAPVINTTNTTNTVNATYSPNWLPPAVGATPTPVPIASSTGAPSWLPVASAATPTAAPFIIPGASTVGSFDNLPALPPYTTFLNAGKTVLNYHAANGYTVVVQRSDDARETEDIMATCYDVTGKPLWTAKETCPENGELYGTGAFIAGTQDAPLVVLFVSGQGFTAYGVDGWGSQRWAVKDEAAQRVSGALTAVADADGTIFAIGYYSSAPICISPAGKLLWAAENDNVSVYWPTDIVIGETAIDVYYDTPEEGGDDMCDVITYDKTTGARIMLQRRPRLDTQGEG